MTENGNIATLNDQIVTVGGRVPYITAGGSLIVPLTVKGTHFPASPDPNNLSSRLEIENQNNVEGEVIIDFSDGSGKHTYPFYNDGGVMKVYWYRQRNSDVIGEPTPTNIWRNNLGEIDGHFYEDLPLPDGTVDDTYDHERTIYIEFTKYYNLKRLFFVTVDLYGILPKEIGRLINLDSFTLSGPTNSSFRHLTGIAADFEKTYSRFFVLSNTGITLDTPIPEWVLKSHRTEFFGFASFFNFSGMTIEEARIDDFLENPEYLPKLNSFNLGNCGISGYLPDLRQTITGAVNLNSNQNLLGFSPDLSTYHFSRFEIDDCFIMPSEFQRLLENAETPIINAVRTNINVNFSLNVDNTTLKELYIGRGSSYGGAFPSFLTKLTALEILEFNNNSSSVPNASVTGWGSGLPPSLKILRIANMPNLPPELPVWFDNLVNLTIFNSDCWETVARADAHVMSVFNKAVNYNPTGDFWTRDLDFNLQSQNKSARPSGTYQMPSGYVQDGTSGTPASAMEAVWALVHNYKMTVTVRNVAGNGKDIYTP